MIRPTEIGHIVVRVRKRILTCLIMVTYTLISGYDQDGTLSSGSTVCHFAVSRGIVFARDEGTRPAYPFSGEKSKEWFHHQPRT